MLRATLTSGMIRDSASVWRASHLCALDHTIGRTAAIGQQTALVSPQRKSDVGKGGEAKKGQPGPQANRVSKRPPDPKPPHDGARAAPRSPPGPGSGGFAIPRRHRAGLLMRRMWTWWLTHLLLATRRKPPSSPPHNPMNTETAGANPTGLHHRERPHQPGSPVVTARNHRKAHNMACQLADGWHASS